MATDITIDGNVVGTIEPSALQDAARQRAENLLRALFKMVDLTLVLPAVEGESPDARSLRIAGAIATALGADQDFTTELVSKFRCDYGLLHLAEAVNPDDVVPGWDGRTYKELRFLRRAGTVRFGMAPGPRWVRFTVEEEVVPSLPAPPNFSLIRPIERELEV